MKNKSKTSEPKKLGDPLGKTEDSIPSPEFSLSLHLESFQQRPDYIPKPLWSFDVSRPTQPSHTGTMTRFPFTEHLECEKHLSLKIHLMSRHVELGCCVLTLSCPRKKWKFVVVCLEVNRMIRRCRRLDKMISKFLMAKR